jgi:hypothetical protein
MEGSILNPTAKYFRVVAIKPRATKTKLTYDVVAIDRLNAMETVVMKNMGLNMFIHHIRLCDEVASLEPPEKDDDVKLLISVKCRSLREKDVA